MKERGGGGGDRSWRPATEQELDEQAGSYQQEPSYATQLYIQWSRYQWGLPSIEMESDIAIHCQ